jgi:CO dehydrogenase/acetyl-CoA synthase gamma subunit (corrinoid Fe-S protein)
MSIVEIPRETWSGKVREVTLGAGPGEGGTRTSTVTVGGETTLPFLIRQSGIGERLNHKKLVLPGLVAGLSGGVEEEPPDWQVLVGPRDAVDIPSLLKNVWSA